MSLPAIGRTSLRAGARTYVQTQVSTGRTQCFQQHIRFASRSSEKYASQATATVQTEEEPSPDPFVTLVGQDAFNAHTPPTWKPGSTTDRPLNHFTFGAHPIPGNQIDPVKQVRIPRLASLSAEREWRKLHHAVALRWLGLNGYNNEGGGGHVTVRDPILPDHFWINPHNVSFSHMTPQDLCLVNEDGVVLPEGNMHAINPAGFSIHLAVHRARPDVVAAVHCHSVPSKAFSALGCEVEPITQDACR